MSWRNPLLIVIDLWCVVKSSSLSRMYKDYQPFYDVGNPSPQSPLTCKGSKWSHFLYVIRVLYIPRSHLFQKQKGEVCHWHAILRVKLRLPETFSDEKIVLAPKILLQHMKTKRLFHIIMQYFPWYVSMFKSIVCPCDVNTVWIVCDKPKANWHKCHEIDLINQHSRIASCQWHWHMHTWQGNFQIHSFWVIPI